MNIDANIRRYMVSRGPTDRFASFDYCFNYFRSFWEERRALDLVARDSLQLSCLQLGFYLASWGMYRGSTALLQRSLRHLAPVVDIIAHAPDALWAADAHDYGAGTSARIMATSNDLGRSLGGGATDTLVTKIMLGTFGCVPAFDQNFRSGSGISTFNAAALRRLASFYTANEREIETNRFRTLDFESGKPTDRRYTRAKVLDMIFFVEGGGSANSEL